jgi:hypothetical protein
MTVSTVTDSQSRTAAYADPAADRRPPNTVSDRNAASSKPIILASLPIVPFIITGAVETFGDLVDRQDAFNGAEGSISGDTIKLKADSQNDAGLAISLKKPISGRIVFSFTGSDKLASDNYGVTVQFIKAGPNYDYTRDKILDQKNIRPHGSAQHTHLAIPEGTDKIVVMKVGRGSFEINMSGIKLIKPVSIPVEAINEEFRDGEIGLQYYPGMKYEYHSRSSSGSGYEIEIVKEAKDSGSQINQDEYSARCAYWGGGEMGETQLNLTKGVIYSKGEWNHDPRYQLGQVWEKGGEGFAQKMEFIINLFSREQSPEIQGLVKLLEGYIAKHGETK